MTNYEFFLYCRGYDAHGDPSCLGWCGGGLVDLMAYPPHGDRVTPCAFDNCRAIVDKYCKTHGGASVLLEILPSMVATFEHYVGKQWATDHTVAELVGFAVLYDGQGVGLAPRLAEFAGWCGCGYDPATSDPIVWGGIFAELFAQLVFVSLRGCLKDTSERGW